MAVYQINILYLCIEIHKAMFYKKGINRRQLTFFPECLDDYVSKDNPVIFFDAFVDKLDIKGLNFTHSTTESTGAPPYDPRDLIKLYIYGYFYHARSSRQLNRLCYCNIEVMWLINKLCPDFHTIANFRKDNVEGLKKVFKEFNRFCLKLNLFSKSYISVDGSKFKAVNSKDRNFTLDKLDDRIEHIDNKIEEYLELLKRSDEGIENEDAYYKELSEKLAALKGRKAIYEGYHKYMTEHGKTQLSLTDPEAKLMKQNQGFSVCYNVQTAVDAGSHLIVGYSVTDNPTDHGEMTSISREVKNDLELSSLSATADNGYEDSHEYPEMLYSGIIPQVITKNRTDEITIDIEYSPTEIDNKVTESTDYDSLKKCLQAGVVPKVYEGVLEVNDIVEIKKYSQPPEHLEVQMMNQEEKKKKAQEGYLIRDPELNVVYCPQGQTLYLYTERKNGEMVFCNKSACKKCLHKCTSSIYRRVFFNKDSIVKIVKDYNEGDDPERLKNTANTKGRKLEGSKKMVRYKLKLNKEIMADRKCLSEHPFGTIKRTLGQYYFLLKGSNNVSAEMAISCLSYNLRRAINLVGVPNMLKAL